MAHGTARAASASATGLPSARRSSSPNSSRESRRQSRSCSFEGGENPASSRGNGGHRRSGCRVFEGGVGQGEKGLPETPARCRGRRVPEVHREVREAHCRVGPRARVGAVRSDLCQGTSSEVGNRAVSSRGRGTSSRRLEGPDGSLANTSEFFARRTGPGSSQPCREASGCGARSISCQCPLWFLQSWTIGCRIFKWSSRVR